MHDKVVIVNENGKVIGSKLRVEVDKKTDILFTVYVFVFTKDKKLLLSVIPENPINTNLFVGKYGITVATLLREGETKEKAATRGLKKELLLEDIPQYVGEAFFLLSENVKRKVAVYTYVLNELPLDFNRKDIAELKVVKNDELEKMLQVDKNRFADTFFAVYNHFQKKLSYYL